MPADYLAVDSHLSHSICFFLTQICDIYETMQEDSEVLWYKRY